MSRTFFVVVFAFASATLATAQTYCSLMVSVVDVHGNEVEADVTMQERDGRAVTLENQPGGVRFCDLGLEPVMVIVGSPECNQVSVRQVPLDWGRTTTLKVVYDREPCLREAPPVAACKLLFRFSDERGKWIPGVAIESPALKIKSRSDDFGRVLLGIGFNTELRAMARRDGFEPYPIHLTCTRDLMDSEWTVRLRPVK